ncbi:GNAT family N-acetyltransferase [Clostridium sp. DJ247]|uniref:GNAT family N-acetyltransferase n=1 Tax=Clostridium sp. DJ247 TaxID=2726188 RepID=UPI0016294AD2|nr:GNAT family N-acetyltransferase [Clostridium sp. DJ247]MBC2582517.1 GNAT family N-acetyltransferase [Clostridium sp. DJ247]
MVNYKRCSEVKIDLVYEAFKNGFSDYIIKLEISRDVFISRFFGQEGNNLYQSFIALNAEKPIGLILGSVKMYEGIKTIRCGTLAVVPEYRGKGVSTKLMELHKKEAVKQECKQSILEVITENHRAISFYKKLAYEKVYDLTYYALQDFSKLNSESRFKIYINPSSIEELKLVREKIKDIHINWQNHIEFIEKSEGQITLGCYINEKLAGIISANKNTRINFIWVENALRHKNIASNLIVKVINELKLSKVSIGFSSNSSIYGFVRHVGFKEHAIKQYEMYCIF